MKGAIFDFKNVQFDFKSVVNSAYSSDDLKKLEKLSSAIWHQKMRIFFLRNEALTTSSSQYTSYWRSEGASNLHYEVVVYLEFLFLITRSNSPGRGMKGWVCLEKRIPPNRSVWAFLRSTANLFLSFVWQQSPSDLVSKMLRQNGYQPNVGFLVSFHRKRRWHAFSGGYFGCVSIVKYNGRMELHESTQKKMSW